MKFSSLVSQCLMRRGRAASAFISCGGIAAAVFLWVAPILADNVTATVVVSIYPADPANLTATANSTTQISLSWTNNAASGDGFSVERKTGASGTYAQLATTTLSITTYQDTGLAAATAYYYRVRAFNSSGYSNYTNEASSTTNSVPPPSGNSGSSGGGGGGGGGGYIGPPVSATQVIFKGKAYPLSTVTLLKDAQVAATVPAGPDANFSINLSGLSAGTYSFGVWAEDRDGNRSIVQTFTISVTDGVTTAVSGIFIPPFFTFDKSEVKKGDIITFFGSSAPAARVTIIINSDQEIVRGTTSSDDGSWLYKFDTDPLDYGDHTAKTQAAKDGDITGFSAVKRFVIGTKNIPLAQFPKVPARVDKNGDGRVNLVDFSILAYWYKRPNPPAGIDVNGDGKIDLTDFSILAYYWTG